jgi:hypothetical protein
MCENEEDSVAAALSYNMLQCPGMDARHKAGHDAVQAAACWRLKIYRHSSIETIARSLAPMICQ